MAKPIANFSLNPTFLSVAFTDKSLNTPTSYAWTFAGPADIATSTAANPTVVWSAGGQYAVGLTVTNADGTDIKNVLITVSATVGISLSINEMVDCQAPAGILLDEVCKVAYIQMWQIHLAPLVSPKITGSNVLNENAWKPLENALIAQLVAYQLILDAAKQAMIGLQQNTVDPTAKGGAPIKKIETGPSNVEWYDSSSFWSTIMKPGGAIDTIKEAMCGLASRLRIKLAMCPPLVQDPIIPEIQHRPKESTPDFPFGIDPDKLS